jgi:ATP-dependent helicase/nuclease subunit A
LPAGFLDVLPPSEDLPRPLSPSGASVLIEEARAPVVSNHSPVLDTEAEPVFAFERGLVVHKMLQMLPGLPEAERRAAASRYLDLVAPRWTPDERSKTLEQIEAILGAPRFAPLFGPGSRAEVSVLGELTVRGKQRSISGKIDRLAVTENEVLIVDYKTGRPATIEEVPASYMVQLALYRELLKPLYPGKAISAVLLFTEGPRLVEAPAAAMEHALARLTQP